MQLPFTCMSRSKVDRLLEVFSVLEEAKWLSCFSQCHNLQLNAPNLCHNMTLDSYSLSDLVSTVKSRRTASTSSGHCACGAKPLLNRKFVKQNWCSAAVHHTILEL